MWPFTRRTDKNKALITYMEFGPKMRIDRLERLSGKYPAHDLAEFEGWIEEFKSIEKSLWSIAERDDFEQMSNDQIGQTLAEEYPFMDAKSLSQCVGRARYYHVKL